MTAWDTEPGIDAGELSDLLSQASLPDADGNTPATIDWIPTYDLNAAAAQVWLIKAARAAATTDEPTAGIVTSKVFDNCRKMARLYASKRNATIPVR